MCWSLEVRIELSILEYFLVNSHRSECFLFEARLQPRIEINEKCRQGLICIFPRLEVSRVYFSGDERSGRTDGLSVTYYLEFFFVPVTSSQV